MENSDILKKRLEWMKCDDRTSDLFLNGVKEFLNFAFGELDDNDYKDEERLNYLALVIDAIIVNIRPKMKYLVICYLMEFFEDMCVGFIMANSNHQRKEIEIN
ncbi:unnamed protein product [Amaranthus hypochondriacus]